MTDKEVAYVVIAQLVSKGWPGQHASAPEVIRLFRCLRTKYKPLKMSLIKEATQKQQNEKPRFEFCFEHLFNAVDFCKEAPKIIFEEKGKDSELYTPPYQPVGSRFARDSTYFSSYGRLQIHCDMIRDSARTGIFQQAIKKASSLIAGKVVLDVGSGTGILSIFAAKAGAKQVYAVEKSPNIVDLSRRIVQENELEDKIQVIHGLVEEVDLPEPHVDIIISEWMGYCLFYEGMLLSVLRARDRFLKPGGLVMPCTATLSLCGISNKTYYDSLFTVSPVLADIDLSALLPNRILSKVKICKLPQDNVVTEHFCLGVLKLETLSMDEAKGLKRTCFSLRPIERISTCVTIHALALSFDVLFSNVPDEKPLVLSTKPSAEENQTHWYQGLLLLRNPLVIAAKETLVGSLELSYLPGQERGIKIVLDILGPRKKEEPQTYFLF